VNEASRRFADSNIEIVADRWLKKSNLRICGCFTIEIVADRWLKKSNLRICGCFNIAIVDHRLEKVSANLSADRQVCGC
jgi:hypothetical protein